MQQFDLFKRNFTNEEIEQLLPILKLASEEAENTVRKLQKAQEITHEDLRREITI